MVKLIIFVIMGLIVIGNLVSARPGPKVDLKQQEFDDLEAGDKKDLQTSASYGIGYYGGLGSGLGSGLGYPYLGYGGYRYNSLGYGYPYGYSSYGYPSYPYYGGSYYSGYGGYGGYHGYGY